MNMRFLLVASAAFVFAACGNNQNGHDHDHAGHDHAHHDHAGHDHGHDHGNAESPDGIHYGVLTNVTTDGATALADVLAKLQKKEGMSEVVVSDDGTKAQGFSTKVEGTITEVCQKAGCWFKMVGPDGKDIFFKMKEHKGVPIDVVGKTVVVQGVAYESVTSVDELRHYAEDKNASKEEIAAITQPKTEYKVYAEGVAIKK